MGEAKGNTTLRFLAGHLIIFLLFHPASGHAVPMIAAPAGQETSSVAVVAPSNDSYAQKANSSQEKQEQWAPVVKRTVISVVQSDRIWSQWIWTSITNGTEIITDKHTLTPTEMKEWEASEVEGKKNPSPYAPALNLPDGTPVWRVQNPREREKLRQISGLPEETVFYANAGRVETNPDFVADRFTYYAVKPENALNPALASENPEPHFTPQEEWLVHFAESVRPLDEPERKSDGKKPSQIPAVVCSESEIDTLGSQGGEMNCTAFEGSRASQIFLDPSEKGLQWINAGYGDDYGFYQNAGDGKQTRYESLAYDSPSYLDWLPKTYRGVQVIGIYTSRQLLHENRIDYFLAAWPKGAAPDISISSQDQDIIEKYDPERHIIAHQELPSPKSIYRLYLVAFVGNGLFTEHGVSEPPQIDENENELYQAAAAILKVSSGDIAHVVPWKEAVNIYWVWARKGPVDKTGIDLFESHLSQPQWKSQFNSEVPEGMANYLASAEFGLGILIGSEKEGKFTTLRYESGSVILETAIPGNLRIREISTASSRLEFVHSNDRRQQELFSFAGRNPEQDYVALINRAPQAGEDESALWPEAIEWVEKAYQKVLEFIDRLDPHRSERETLLQNLADIVREAGLFTMDELLKFYVRGMDRLIKIGKSVYNKIDQRMIERTRPRPGFNIPEEAEIQISRQNFVEEGRAGHFEIFVFNRRLGIPTGAVVASGILSFDGTPVFNTPAPAHLVLSSEPVPPPVIPILADRFPVPLRSRNILFREELDPLQIQNHHQGDGGSIRD